MPARRRDRRRRRRERTMERLMADSSGAGRMTRGNGHSGLWQRLRGLLKARQDEAQLRETPEEIIDEIKDVEREEERKRVVEGQRVSVRVGLGGSGISKKKTTPQ